MGVQLYTEAGEREKWIGIGETSWEEVRGGFWDSLKTILCNTLHGTLVLTFKCDRTNKLLTRWAVFEGHIPLTPYARHLGVNLYYNYTLRNHP